MEMSTRRPHANRHAPKQSFATLELHAEQTIYGFGKKPLKAIQGWKMLGNCMLGIARRYEKHGKGREANAFASKAGYYFDRAYEIADIGGYLKLETSIKILMQEAADLQHRTMPKKKPNGNGVNYGNPSAPLLDGKTRRLRQYLSET